MSDIIIDLGEDGQILVESTNSVVEQALLLNDDNAVEKAGMREIVQQAGQTITVNAEKVLKLPLTGLAKLFLAALPYAASNDQFQLDEFSIEFNVGIKTETGVDAGAVAKVMPEGSFKCTYKWKHQPNPSS